MFKSIFDPIKPTTEKSSQNIEIEKNRPINTRYTLSDKGRMLTRKELFEARKWGALYARENNHIDGCASHARYVDITRN